MTEQTTALTVVDRAKQALAVAKTEEELKALAAGSVTITEITNPDGREQVHAARMVLKNTRVEIKKLGKAARDEATKFSSAVIAEETRLIALIEPEEDRLQALQETYDAAIEAEKQARIAAEMKRVADLQLRVSDLRGNRTLTPMAGSARIAEVVSDIEGMAVDDSFEEFREQAELAKADGLKWLREMHAAAAAHEAEQARIKAEREELAKLRAEQVERDRLAAVERKALADKQAQEAAAERARIAEEDRQARAAQAAEAARVAAELRVEREEQEKIERQRQAEWDRREAEQKAVRDAEAKKLAEERADFDRLQAEARRVQEEQERVQREQARLASIKKPADEELLGVLTRHYNVPTSKVIEWLLAVDFTSMEKAA